ncbi:MAG: 16S rRNA (guanine(527)-N(7))-methyltransferase RsmG [Planctomycetota bacterium]
MSVDVPPPTEAFRAACDAYGVSLDAGDADRLRSMLRILYDANQTTNLTAIRDPAEGWLRHVFDALTLLPLLAEATAEADATTGRLRIGDVGSGGGVPALVVAIAMPEADVTLLEATGRKCDFLRSAAGDLGLGNVSVVNGRAERAGAFPGGELRDAFDVVTARALGRVAVASELCVPLARVGGLVLLIKGQAADEELSEARQALHELHASHAGTVDSPTGRIVVLEKTRRTPKKYPRRDGEPKRAPIGVPAKGR